MTVHIDLAPTGQDAATEFDLDISIVESDPVITDLMHNTDDNCTAGPVTELVAGPRCGETGSRK
ncbi:MAG: FxLD family lanthipeptide [Actinomycetota bacterium]|nr:FxLD family lanthipeptide [Actinomycetota bacterium]